MTDIINTLNKIQQELKVPKGQKNNFGGYKYRSCEDIMEAVKKVLPEGYIVTTSDEMIMLGDRFYIKAVAMLSGDGKEFRTFGFARESETKKGMDDSQITGTASSYARKYALNGLFAIDDTKDADTDSYAKKTRGSSTQSKGGSQDLGSKELISMLSKLKTNEELDAFRLEHKAQIGKLDDADKVRTKFKTMKTKLKGVE